MIENPNLKRFGFSAFYRFVLSGVLKNRRMDANHAAIEKRIFEMRLLCLIYESSRGLRRNFAVIGLSGQKILPCNQAVLMRNLQIF